MGEKLRVFVLLVIFFTHQLACVTVQAKDPDALAGTDKAWDVTEPKWSFLNRKAGFFRAGPFKTSDIEDGVFDDVAVKLDWSKTNLEKGSEKRWLSFTVLKNKKTIAWIACQSSYAGVSYGNESSKMRLGEGSRSCDIKTDRHFFRLNSYHQDLGIAGLGAKKPPHSVSFSTGVMPAQKFQPITGINVHAVNDKDKLLGWFKTYGDGDPQRIRLAPKLSAHDEAAVVATGFAYMALDRFLCVSNC